MQPFSYSLLSDSEKETVNEFIRTGIKPIVGRTWATDLVMKEVGDKPFLYDAPPVTRVNSTPSEPLSIEGWAVLLGIPVLGYLGYEAITHIDTVIQGSAATLLAGAAVKLTPKTFQKLKREGASTLISRCGSLAPIAMGSAVASSIPLIHELLQGRPSFESVVQTGLGSLIGVSTAALAMHLSNTNKQKGRPDTGILGAFAVAATGLVTAYNFIPPFQDALDTLPPLLHVMPFMLFSWLPYTAARTYQILKEKGAWRSFSLLGSAAAIAATASSILLGSALLDATRVCDNKLPSVCMEKDFMSRIEEIFKTEKVKLPTLKQPVIKNGRGAQPNGL